MKTASFDAVVLSSASEKENFLRFAELARQSPIPADELLPNLGLYLTSKTLSRLLFFCEIYQHILTRHGVVFEFGVRWGQTLSLLSALRGIYEPFNRHRKIVGFDTFEGFKGVGPEDGGVSRCQDGSFSVPASYERHVEEVLALQEALNPMPHLRRFELVKGDACRTVPDYLRRHPETLVSLAIFDFDIYKPTRAALEAIKPHLYKGSVLVFDELCDDIFPGETQALREVLALDRLEIRRIPTAARLSYVILD